MRAFLFVCVLSLPAAALAQDTTGIVQDIPVDNLDDDLVIDVVDQDADINEFTESTPSAPQLPALPVVPELPSATVFPEDTLTSPAETLGISRENPRETLVEPSTTGTRPVPTEELRLNLEDSQTGLPVTLETSGGTTEVPTPGTPAEPRAIQPRPARGATVVPAARSFGAGHFGSVSHFGTTSTTTTTTTTTTNTTTTNTTNTTNNPRNNVRATPRY